MKAVIDTSSLLSLVWYYLPFDKKGILLEVIKRKIQHRDLIILDAVYEESKFVSQKIISKHLHFLFDKEFLKENKVIVKTDELIPVSPVKFLNMVKNQFVAVPSQFRKLSEAEFEVQKNRFIESADAKLIMYCQHLMGDNVEEEIYLVTEETTAANDLKLFKKIPAICDILGIPVITLPNLLEKYPEVYLGFDKYN